MKTQADGWMSGIMNGMHGGMWLWPIISVLVVALIAYMIVRVSKK